MTDLLWQPSASQIACTQLHDFILHVNQRHGLLLSTYAEIYQWSINHPDLFWENLAQFCDIHFTKPYKTVLQTGARMIDAKWFVDSELNFASHLLRHQDSQLAIIAYDEKGKQSTYTYLELYQAVAKSAQWQDFYPTFLKPLLPCWPQRV
jgi:acetoacetyl-CoA synthetase